MLGAQHGTTTMRVCIDLKHSSQDTDVTNPAFQTEIRVISLANARQRRDRFEVAASTSPLRWSFFDALSGDAKEPPYDNSLAIRHTGRALLPGERGCYASHVAVWREFLQGRARQLIVLEDDVLVDWAYLAKVAEADHAPAGHHYLRLFSKRPPRHKILERNFLEPLRFLIEIHGFAYGTQGYLLTREGAERMSAHCKTLSRPIDVELERAWAHGLRNLAIFPYPIIEVSQTSTIGDQRRDTFAEPLRFNSRVRHGFSLSIERIRAIAFRFS